MKKIFFISIFVLLISVTTFATYKGSKKKYNVIDEPIPTTPIDSEITNTEADKTNEIIDEVIPNNEEIEESKFILPVNSTKFGMDFSNGKLIYSKTLNEWTTHNGIDIIGNLNDPVLATNDGKIIEISSSANDGIKIVIEHKNGYKSIYSNLSTTKLVNLNEEVKKGTVISGIGKTAEFEYDEPNHLHFEMYKDGIVINPLKVIYETDFSFGYN